MTIEEKQKYDRLINDISKNMIKVLFIFLIIPIIIVNLTPMVYWQVVALTIATSITKTLIKYTYGKYKEYRRNN
jgi:low affinity Fe/Cu permease